MQTHKYKILRRRQRGMTLVMVAVSLSVLMGLMALVIDLAWLYVAHVEAQNTADAAALAAARGIVSSGYPTIAPNDVANAGRDLASSMAVGEGQAVGSQYTIVGQTPNITVNPPDFSTTNNPLVTATASANVPTFFIQALSSSFAQVNITASATAGVYNPQGTSGAVSVSGPKPWMIPNLDPGHADTDPGTGCTSAIGAASAPIVNPNDGTICHPGAFAFGGYAVGANFNLTPGDPTAVPAAGVFYQFSPGLLATGLADNIPSCGNGFSLYQAAIAGMFTAPVTSGTAYTIDPLPPDAALTQLAVQCLIHEDAGTNSGQDLLVASSPSGLNVWPSGGTNNPITGAPGNNLSRSDSLVTIPIYDVGTGPLLAPCGSCSVTIVGFLQVFINGAPSGGNPFFVTVQNVIGATTSGSPIITPAGSPVPVRLVQ